MAFLSSIEEELFKSFMQSPKENSSILISPEVDMQPEWCATSFGREIFGAILVAAEDDNPINGIASILIKVSLDEAQKKYLFGLWSDRSNAPNILQITSLLKQQNIIGQANKAIAECQSIVNKHPSLYQEQYTALGSTLDILTHEGEIYDPTPSAPSSQPRRSITGHWHDKVYDEMFEIRDNEGDYHSGILNYASALIMGATKQGKTTSMYTIVALSIVQGKSVLYLSNEPTKEDVRWGVNNALWGIFNYEKSRDEISDMVDAHMKFYPDIYKFDQFRRRIHWNRPEITIMDSLDSLGFPSEASRSPIEDQHRQRAVALRDIPTKYRTMLLIPANGSDAMQTQLREKDIAEINSVKPYGSVFYPSLLDYTFAFARDREDSNTAYMKRVVNRPSGRMGDCWHLHYNHKGSFYNGVGRRYA